MTYVQQTWTPNVTPVDAARMTHIEAGIAAVEAEGLPQPVVNGQWVKGVGGAAVWSAITVADVAGAEATANKDTNGGYVGRDTSGRAQVPRLYTNGYVPASNAVLLAVGDSGNDLEFGHSNTTGYRSTLGHDQGGGNPFVGFAAEAGTTNNTYRTRGNIGSLLHTDLFGSLQVQKVPSANADNQTAVAAAISASAFNVVSDRDVKHDIDDVSDERAEWNETLMRARPYRFRRYPEDALHVGLMADELPPDVIVAADSKIDAPAMVDVYKLCTTLLGSLQLLAERVAAIERTR